MSRPADFFRFDPELRTKRCAAPPYFHAYHGSHEAKFHIRTGECLWGALPPAARRLVLKWADTFADGKRGILDMTHELRGRFFGPLQDVDGELATVVWPTGADLAPERFPDGTRHPLSCPAARGATVHAALTMGPPNGP